MSFFKLEIIANSKTIHMEQQISDITVTLDTPDDKASGKSSSILAQISVNGVIDPNDSNPYIELFNWAKDFSSDGQYRKVMISVGNNQDKFCRSYEFEQMFVVDYKENYVKNNITNPISGVGTFTLLLNQEANNLQKAETFDK